MKGCNLLKKSKMKLRYSQTGMKESIYYNQECYFS